MKTTNFWDIYKGLQKVFFCKKNGFLRRTMLSGTTLNLQFHFLGSLFDIFNWIRTEQLPGRQVLHLSLYTMCFSGKGSGKTIMDHQKWTDNDWPCSRLNSRLQCTLGRCRRKKRESRHILLTFITGRRSSFDVKDYSEGQNMLYLCNDSNFSRKALKLVTLPGFHTQSNRSGVLNLFPIVMQYCNDIMEAKILRTVKYRLLLSRTGHWCLRTKEYFKKMMSSNIPHSLRAYLFRGVVRKWRRKIKFLESFEYLNQVLLQWKTIEETLNDYLSDGWQ